MTLDGAGNELDKAKRFNITSTPQTFTDWLGSTDTNDYYRFTLDDISNFNLTLEGLSADADVRLLDSSGNTIATSNRSGNTSESINRTLDAGDYFIQVYPWSNNTDTNYSLNVSATALDFVGNNRENASVINLDGNGTTKTFTDLIGGGDTNDYYRFSAGSISNINLTLDGLSADADVRLLDSNGNTISISNNGGRTAESISRTLNVGDYYIEVYPWSGDFTSYNLNLSTTALDFAGNSLNEALGIELNSATQTFTDWLGSTDTNDYYRFTLDKTSILELTLDGLSADAHVQLLDSSGRTISISNKSGINAESISQFLDADNYYIKVYPGNNNANTSYNLNVSATPEDFAGNNLDNARSITLDESGTAKTFTDWIDSFDNKDYYRFNLISTSTLEITMDGLAADADIQLLDNNGNTISVSNNGGINAETINQTLNAGDYYIQVYPWRNAATSYNLNVSATIFDSAGNNRNQARGIELNSTTQTFTDWLGSIDTNDYYRFELLKTSTLELTLDGLSADADVQLLDSNGNTIDSSFESGITAESISRTLDAGDYFIQVYPWEKATTHYNLNVSATALVEPEQPNTAPWTRRSGSDGDDFSNSITVDSQGNVYITGYTDDTVEGNYDSWLTKYDSGGTQLWKTQLGLNDDNFSYSVAVDDTGSTYITGYYDSSNDGYDYDALVAKYDSNGNFLWEKSLNYFGENEYSYSVAVDKNQNAFYTAGITKNTQAGAIPSTWVSKHSSADGSEEWSIKVDAPVENMSIKVDVPAENIAIDTDGNGNVYIAGYFNSLFGEKNTRSAWVAKYKPNREQEYIYGLDTSEFDVLSDIDVDTDGKVYITGQDDDSARVAGYSGTYQEWYDYLYSSDNITGDYFTSNVVVGDDGNVYIRGRTEGTLEEGNVGSQNDWVTKYSSDGNLISTQEIDIPYENFVSDMTIGNTGNIYITGETENWSDANSFGDVDAFVTKF